MATSRPGLIALAMLATYVVVVLPSLGQSLLETHAYRQTQTAYTAVLYAERGIDLFHPPLPVLGIPGIVPIEFPLFQAAVATLISAGLPPDVAARVTCLVTFIATGTFLYILASQLVGKTWGLVALGAYLFNPHALIYGRTSVIDYLAAAFGLMFILAVIRLARRPDGPTWVLALTAACAVGLVKVTTAPVFLLPPLLWRDPSGRPAYRTPQVWTVLALSAVVAIAWGIHASGVRSELPAADFLSAQSILRWVMGTPESRANPDHWGVPLLVGLALTGAGLIAWMGLGVREALRHPQSHFLLAMLAVMVITPLVLFGAYSRHEYYYAALAPFVAISIALGARRLRARIDARWARLTAAALVAAWLATLAGLSSSWWSIYGVPPNEERVIAAAEYLRTNSDADDWLVIEGMGWNPTLLYYARRQAFADPTGDNLVQPGDIDLDLIRSDPRYGPGFTCGLNGCVLQGHSTSTDRAGP